MKLFLSIFLLSISGINIAQAAEPFGLWLTENKRSAIKLAPCGDKVCGHIEWIIEGGMQFDTKNPKENLRHQPMCGLEILKGFSQNPNNANEWTGGHIYKADDGDIYTAQFTMRGDNKMVVRGYVGIPLLGKSQTWTRVDGKSYPKCRKP